MFFTSALQVVFKTTGGRIWNKVIALSCCRGHMLALLLFHLADVSRCPRQLRISIWLKPNRTCCIVTYKQPTERCSGPKLLSRQHQWQQWQAGVEAATSNCISSLYHTRGHMSMVLVSSLDGM
jgi:hypothetical protein